MKGLILKDLYQAARYCRTMLLILIVFLGVSLVTPANAFYTYYPCLLISMIPITLISYDERSHWDQYSVALPCSRAQVVGGKYIVGLILSAAVLVISLIAAAVRGVIAKQPMTGPEVLATAELMAAVSLGAPALSMPWFFKLGAEKGRIAYYAAFGLFFGGAAVLSRAVAETKITAFSGSLHLALGVIAVLYAASWALSAALYRNKEF